VEALPANWRNSVQERLERLVSAPPGSRDRSYLFDMIRKKKL